MANKREHPAAPVALVLAAIAACGEPAADPDRDPRVDSCAAFTAALDHAGDASAAGAPGTGRELARRVDDAADAARTACDDPLAAVRGERPAHQLARARLLDDRPGDALAALAADAGEPAIHVRRAELLDRLGRTTEALAAIDDAYARTFGARVLDGEAVAATRRLLAASVDARSGHAARAALALAIAPLPDRPRLAFRAAADAPDLDAVVAAAREPELATAAGDRLEEARGSAAALAARARAVALADATRPGQGATAEQLDALARALAAAGRLDDALAAWDRAAAAAPAQPSYRLAPVRALVAAGDMTRAHTRVIALADTARARADVDDLLAASTAAGASRDWPLAVELARTARSQRPGDGRLAFELAIRLAGAGDHAAAAGAFAELLACGAHGRPWHRHEVAGKLVALARDAPRAVTAALAAKRACTAVDAPDVERYLAAVRAELR